MSNEQNIPFTRLQLRWLTRQLESGYKRAKAEGEKFTGELDREQTDKLNEIVKHQDELAKLVMEFTDKLSEGERNLGKLATMRGELEEALTLVEEPEAVEEINKRLANLPQDEGDYVVTMDRGSIKFTLKLVENDLTKYRTHVIPAYEKADPADFKDAVCTRSYWLNMKKKEKRILEELKLKLEGAL